VKFPLAILHFEEGCWSYASDEVATQASGEDSSGKLLTKSWSNWPVPGQSKCISVERRRWCPFSSCVGSSPLEQLLHQRRGEEERPDPEFCSGRRVVQLGVIRNFTFVIANDDALFCHAPARTRADGHLAAAPGASMTTAGTRSARCDARNAR